MHPSFWTQPVVDYVKKCLFLLNICNVSMSKSLIHPKSSILLQNKLSFQSTVCLLYNCIDIRLWHLNNLDDVNLTLMNWIDLWAIVKLTHFNFLFCLLGRQNILKRDENKQAEKLKSREMKEGWMKNDKRWMKNDEEWWRMNEEW